MKSVHNECITKGNRRELIQLQNSIKHRLETLLYNINDLKNVIRLREIYFNLLKKLEIMKII